MLTRKQMAGRLRRRTDAVIDVHAHVGLSEQAYMARAYPYALSVEDMIVRLQTLGIDATVVFPMGSAYYDPKSLGGKVRARRGGPCRFPYEQENAILLDEVYRTFPKHSERFLPFFMFDPSRRQADQVRHMTALAAEFPVYGLKTVTSYNQAFVADLLKKDGAVILDFAAEHDLPVLFHTAVHPGDPWANVFDILKIVEARPEVRFCLAHTARFSRAALDQADALPNCVVDLSAFHIHCQLAVAKELAIPAPAERFKADYRRPLDAMKKLVDAYPETLVWGTDTPYYYFISDFTDDQGDTQRFELRCEWDTEVKALRRLPKAVIRRVAHDNSLRFLFG